MDPHATRQQLRDQITTLRSTLAVLELRLHEIETADLQNHNGSGSTDGDAVTDHSTAVDTPLPIAAG